MTSDDFSRAFTTYAADKLTQSLEQVLRCAGLLHDDELWQRVNAHTNSVGNLLLHLTGNVRQWILSGLAGEPFDRDRPAEFAAAAAPAGVDCAARLRATVSRAIAVIRTLDAAALAREYTIQRYTVRGLVAVFHVVEHFSNHTGQIVHMTKALRDVDLSLYDAQGQRRSGPLQP